MNQFGDLILQDEVCKGAPRVGRNSAAYSAGPTHQETPAVTPPANPPYLPTLLIHATCPRRHRSAQQDEQYDRIEHVPGEMSAERERRA
jgi:hypothetical protein